MSGILFNMEAITWAIIILVIIACIVCGIMAWSNKKNGQLDNSAQYAATAGVLGTFAGITIGLYNFDTSDIATSIAGFLNGMKLAFITSIIGMLASIIIKGMQDKVEVENDTSQKNANQAMQDMDDSLKSIAVFNEQTIAILQENKQDTQRMVAAIDINSANMQKTATSLNEVALSLQKSSNVEMAQSIAALKDTIMQMVESTQKNNQLTAGMFQAMNLQNKSLSELKQVLQQSTQQQYDTMMEQNQNLSAMKEIMQANGDRQAAIMEEKLAALQDISNNSYQITCEMSVRNGEFHKNMMESAKRQEQMLSLNNQNLLDMRQSFDAFLEKVADNFSKSFIEALTQSIEKLNVELQEQLGGNFQKLNQAVTDLLDWQINYKEIIEATQRELRANQSQMETFIMSVREFEGYIQETIPNLVEQLGGRIEQFDGSMHQLETTLGGVNTSLETFDAELAKQLTAYTEKMGENLQQMMKDSMGNIDQVLHKFGEVIFDGVSALNVQLRDILLEHRNQIQQHTGETFSMINNQLQAEIAKSFQKFQGDMTNNLAEFVHMMSMAAEEQQNKFMGTLDEQINHSSQFMAQLMEESLNRLDEKMNVSLQHMDASLNDNIQVTMEAMKEDLSDLNRQIAGAAEQQVKELGTALVAITNKMTGNYGILMDKLERLDKVLIANGEMR